MQFRWKEEVADVNVQRYVFWYFNKR